MSTTQSASLTPKAPHVRRPAGSPAVSGVGPLLGFAQWGEGAALVVIEAAQIRAKL